MREKRSRASLEHGHPNEAEEDEEGQDGQDSPLPASGREGHRNSMARDRNARAAVQEGMNSGDLAATARKLMADEKGLLAMDESTGTCDKRFAAAGIPQNAEMRRAYRSLIV